MVRMRNSRSAAASERCCRRRLHTFIVHIIQPQLAVAMHLVSTRAERHRMCNSMHATAHVVADTQSSAPFGRAVETISTRSSTDGHPGPHPFAGPPQCSARLRYDASDGVSL